MSTAAFAPTARSRTALSTEVVAGTACQPLKYPLRRVRCTRKFYATPSNEGLPPMGELTITQWLPGRTVTTSPTLLAPSVPVATLG